MQFLTVKFSLWGHAEICNVLRLAVLLTITQKSVDEYCWCCQSFPFSSSSYPDCYVVWRILFELGAVSISLSLPPPTLTVMLCDEYCCVALCDECCWCRQSLAFCSSYPDCYVALCDEYYCCCQSLAFCSYPDCYVALYDEYYCCCQSLAFCFS